MEKAAKRVEYCNYWADLPKDLLVSIAKKLTIFDYVSFIWVCKDWLSVSTLCCPVKSPLESSLCLMFLRNGGGRRNPIGYWEIGDPSNGSIYKIHVPELSDKTTRCLVSKHGWLLLFSSSPSRSLFFLNPFSRARIDLPWCDSFSGLNWNNRKDPRLPVFTISAPPTSRDCVVWSIRILIKNRREVNLIKRGESRWRSIKHKEHFQEESLVSVLLCEGVLVTRNSSHSEDYLRPQINADERGTGAVYSALYPSVVRFNAAKESLPDKRGQSRTIRDFPTKEVNTGKDSEKLCGRQSQFWVDTFFVGECCPSIDKKGKLFGWHIWDERLCGRFCGTCYGDSFWIEPKWIPPSRADLEWTSLLQ